MSIITLSDYISPKQLIGRHIQTIYPSLFRKINDIRYIRERIETPDQDFLDLDWSRVDSDRLVIISHGLEGNSERSYVKGMARIFNRHGWDALGWNFRGCSGEMNRLPRFYHSGAIEDLDTVIQHARKRYKNISLTGFSLGGNVTLKYLGQSENVPPEIKSAVTFSVPVDLVSSAIQLDRRSNYIYRKRFMNMLCEKVEKKSALFPEQLSANGVRKIKTFLEFDNQYTAPLHGFKDAFDYWTKASSKPHLKKIQVKTLLVNASNDPFLSKECFPIEEAKVNPNFSLEIPSEGGHVGFTSFNSDNIYWSEKRALEFITQTE